MSPPPPCKAGDGWRPPRGVVARVSGVHAREARRAVPGTVCAGPPSARPLVLSGSVLHGCLPTLETVMSSRAGPHAVPFPLSGPGRAAVCHYGVNVDSQLPGQRYTRHTETGADSHAGEVARRLGQAHCGPLQLSRPGEKLRAPGTPGGEGLGFPGATRSSLARPPSWPPCTSPAPGPIRGPRLGPPLLRGEHGHLDAVGQPKRRECSPHGRRRGAGPGRALERKDLSRLGAGGRRGESPCVRLTRGRAPPPSAAAPSCGGQLRAGHTVRPGGVTGAQRGW